MSVQAATVIRVMASAISVANRAGNIIREVMAKGDLGIVEKAKDDLQTEADRMAQTCIIASLAEQYPRMRIIGEEGELDASAVTDDLLVRDTDDEFIGQRRCPAAYEQVPEDELVVWVDPLDGTAEYAKGFVEHVTVLIGIAYKDQAIGGIIHQPFFRGPPAADETPALGRTIWGLRGLGAGGFEVPASADSDRFVVTTTRSHSNELVREALDALRPSEVLRVGGAGFKVLQVLEGKADAYVFASPGCKKWDTCAPEAVLEAFGGRLTDVAGRQYRYGADVEHLNRGGVLATGPGTGHQDLVDKIPSRLKDVLV